MSRKSVLGIDIGYDQLKMALVDNGQVVQVALAQMPENLLKDGHFTSIETMASLIREGMKEYGISANRAAVVLPNENVYVRNVEMPVMTEDQLAYNLPFEFHDYITGEVSDYLFDYAVLGMSEPDAAEQNDFAEPEDPELHLMAVGIERSIIDDIQLMLRKAGLKLVKSAPALCSYISLIRDRQANMVELSNEIGILDIGYHAITMYMYKGDQHVATREFEIGLSSLDDIVADIYGVEKHLAHTYVLNNFENCLENEECINFYDNIAVELMRAINFYQFSNQGSTLRDLWVCGGGALNVPLVRSIDDTLDVDLHLSHELLPDGENIPQYNSFLQAIGITFEI